MTKRTFQDLAAALLLAAATAGLVSAQGADAKAATLVAKLRQALGGESKLALIKSLSLEADMRRVLPAQGSEPGPEMSGDIAIDIGDNAHYLFVDSFSPMAGMPQISLGSAIDGESAWTGPLSAPSGNVMIRTPSGGDPALLRTRFERDLTRIYVALLAGTGREGIEFTYSGIADSPEGRAEVLDVKGPGGFKGKLFLDEKTSRPMMVVYSEAPRRMVMQRGGPGAGGGHGEGPAGAPVTAAPPTPELKEAQMFLSDYKPEGGVSFPRSITIKIQDGPTEEWTVQKIKVNPTFPADHFKKR